MASISTYVDATSIVGGDDDGLSWCDADIIANCDMEALKAGKTSGGVDERNEIHMRLSWALVHSKLCVDVQRGITMLLASKSTCPLQEREKLYLLAVGYYRTGSYKKSRQNLEECLEIEADWEQALILQKLLTRTKKDGALGLAIATGTVGVVGFSVAGVVGAIGAIAVAAVGLVTMAYRA